MPKKPDPICLALTGASGIPYGLRLLECLLAAGEQVYFLMSSAAHLVTAMETELALPKSPAKLEEFLRKRFNAKPDQLQVFAEQDWLSPIASGSAVPRSMVVCPCSSGCLSAIATGSSNNVLERAADVVLKEGRQLILVHRETPVSVIHLENSLKLARMGVCILPANPGFYHKPKSIDDLVDFIVARILDQLKVEHQLLARWGITE